MTHALLKIGAGGMVALAALAHVITPAVAQEQAGMSHLGIPVDRIGLVAFTIRDQIGENAAETLAAVAECGIENIEFSGSVAAFQGLEPAAIKGFADEYGFNVPSLGIRDTDLTERFDQVIEATQLVGASYVRISPSRPEDGVDRVQYYTAIAELMNEFAPRLSEAGVTIAYHNHNWEFEDAGDGRTGYQILLENTDPETVGFELDLYWAVVGDADPIGLIQDNPGRFPLMHVKDAVMAVNDEGNEAPTFATVGQGYIDFAEIFAHREVAGTEWYFIENDRPQPDGTTSACESYAYMAATAAPN